MDTNWTKCLQVFPGLFNIDLDFNNVYKHAVYKKLFAALFGSKISMKIPPDRRTKSSIAAWIWISHTSMFGRISLHTLQTTKTKASSKNSTVKYHTFAN